MTTTPDYEITDEEMADLVKMPYLAQSYQIVSLITRLREAEKDAAPQWIPVSDRLPNPNIQVLVYGDVSKVFFALRKNRTLNPWEYLDGDTCHEKITHWMPIPTVPRKEHKQ